MAYVKRVFETDHHGADDGHGGDFMQPARRQAENAGLRRRLNGGI